MCMVESATASEGIPVGLRYRSIYRQCSSSCSSLNRVQFQAIAFSYCIIAAAATSSAAAACWRIRSSNSNM